MVSDVQFLLSGVPQGSVLGPLFFTMYTKSFGSIGQRYGVKYQLYADDAQLYISLDPDNELNLLRLNDNKTNILYLASPHCVKSLKTPALQMGTSIFDYLQWVNKKSRGYV